MSLRTPLALARNHGSAHDGVHHWWQQRLTALALVPLLVWLICAVPMLAGADYLTVRLWLAKPWNATMAVILTWVLFHHAWLGVQVILEDYVHVRWLDVTLQILARFAAYAAAAAASLFIIITAVGR